MKRYGICRIVGTGTATDPQRPKVKDYFIRYDDAAPAPIYEQDFINGLVKIRTAIATGPDGRPVVPWAFVVIDSPQLSALGSDPDIRQLPDATLDATVGSLSAQARASLRDAFDAWGIDRSWINNQTPIRQVVRYLIQRHYATVSEDDFDPAGA
jgi:hypothetical protein